MPAAIIPLSGNWGFLGPVYNQECEKKVLVVTWIYCVYLYL
jgi:hypothetical protein